MRTSERNTPATGRGVSRETSLSVSIQRLKLRLEQAVHGLSDRQNSRKMSADRLPRAREELEDVTDDGQEGNDANIE